MDRVVRRALVTASSASLATAVFVVALPVHASALTVAACAVAAALLIVALRWGGQASALAGRTEELEARVKDQEAGHAERELLLQTIVEAAPMAIVLYGDVGNIVYSNVEARELFFEGKPLEGSNFLRLLKDAKPELREALLAETDSLFTLELAGERETYHLSKRYFDLGGEGHTLVLVKHLTRELARQEIEAWKRIIRVISHELNNSLAPISSMVHSARLIAKSPDQAPKLVRVFDTIEERTAHLGAFLEGYASFARIPKPRLEEVPWPPFLDGMRALWPNVNVGAAPARPGYFDPAQIQQVLINLLKNADEAGGTADITLEVVTSDDGSTELRVADRGKGMTDDVLKNALVPFFSTKQRGSGVGLALSREITEAHRGKLRLQPRDGGGLVVSVWLPGKDAAAAVPKAARLTLTRG